MHSNAHNGMDPDCMKFWYSNNVKIPGNATIPDDLDQSEIACINQVFLHIKRIQENIFETK